jgi:hypothetical protein
LIAVIPDLIAVIPDLIRDLVRRRSRVGARDDVNKSEPGMT